METLGTHDIYQHRGCIFQLHLDGLQPLLSLQHLVFIRKESAEKQKCWPEAVSLYNEQHREVCLVFVCVLCRHFREVVLSIK